RHREQSGDEQIREERELVAREHPRHDRERQQRRQRPQPRRDHSSAPKRPQGRKTRIAPITAYMMTMAVSGRDKTPHGWIAPTIRLPAIQTPVVPRPPMRTA